MEYVLINGKNGTRNRQKPVTVTRIKRICADYILKNGAMKTQYWPARYPLNFPKGRLTH